VFKTQFLSIPSYSRGRDISTGYVATANVDMSKFILEGSYYWRGKEDASTSIRSAYDSEFLYYNVAVRDDQVVPGGIDPGDTVVDRLELWLDMNILGDRFQGVQTSGFRFSTDTNIYAFYITPGDFIDQPANVRVASANIMDDDQVAAARRVKAVAIRHDDGYAIKMRIPWQLLGYPTAPLSETESMEFGMTMLVHDVDNRYRPEEVTTLSTSLNFSPTKPATFGALILVPNSEFYGYSENIFLGEVKDRLHEVGF
jgi:hypothetical protein